jgi:glycosyltransferase involved in cell wall biosynthesis
VSGEIVKVSIVIPCFNEAPYIEECLASVANQDFEGRLEVLVADGGSTDGTRDKIAQWDQAKLNVRLIDNPEQTVSFGLNHAIRASTGNFIIRMDVHSQYANDYVSKCLEVIEATNADNVGGPWRAEGKGFIQKAIALAFQSPFSTGGAKSHELSYQGPADSVYLGCWRKSKLQAIGMFDEEMVRNQDDELNLRIVERGGLVWQSPLIRSVYFPRSSLRRLFNQYFQYGFWKALVLRKHKRFAAKRHMIPAIAIVAITVLIGVATVVPRVRLFVMGLIGVYVAVNLFMSVSLAIKSRSISSMVILPLVFTIFHVAYGIGSLLGLVKFILLGAAPEKISKQISR